MLSLILSGLLNVSTVQNVEIEVEIKADTYTPPEDTGSPNRTQPSGTR